MSSSQSRILRRTGLLRAAIALSRCIHRNVSIHGSRFTLRSRTILALPSSSSNTPSNRVRDRPVTPIELPIQVTDARLTPWCNITAIWRIFTIILSALERFPWALSLKSSRRGAACPVGPCPLPLRVGVYPIAAAIRRSTVSGASTRWASATWEQPAVLRWRRWPRSLPFARRRAGGDQGGLALAPLAAAGDFACVDSDEPAAGSGRRRLPRHVAECGEAVLTGP